VFPRRFATVLVFVALAGVGRGEFVFPRRFATVLVFVALAGVGRGPLDEMNRRRSCAYLVFLGLASIS
jgi:hypothetical protein